MVIYKDGKVTYFNTAFAAFFTADALKAFVDQGRAIDTLFLKEKGFIHTVGQLSHKEKFKNKIAVHIPSGKKYFNVTYKEITFAGTEAASTVYTFYDITWLEYERNKAKNYAEVLEEIIVSTRREQQQTPMQASLQNSCKITQKSEVKESEPEPVAEVLVESKGFIETTDLDKDILRRSRHKQIFTSEEFLIELDEEVYSQLGELESTEKELNYLLEVLSEDKKVLTLLDISGQFNAYAGVIGEMLEFEDLAYAIRSFCKVMNSVNEDTFSDQSVFDTLSEFMRAFLKDLSSWRNTVFVDRAAKDIHYLDSSLLSSCMQIEVLLYEKDNIDEGEDLIFF